MTTTGLTLAEWLTDRFDGLLIEFRSQLQTQQRQGFQRISMSTRRHLLTGITGLILRLYIIGYERVMSRNMTTKAPS